jgi:hypothetical protein
MSNRARRRGGERRGDRYRCVGVVGRSRRGGARQGGRQAGAPGGREEEARPPRGGQGADPAQAAAAEPRVGAGGPGAEEGVPDGAGGEGQVPRAPQCRARAARVHSPEREQHPPTGANLLPSRFRCLTACFVKKGKSPCFSDPL